MDDRKTKEDLVKEKFNEMGYFFICIDRDVGEFKKGEVLLMNKNITKGGAVLTEDYYISEYTENNRYIGRIIK